MANTKFTGRSDSYIFEDAGGKRDQLEQAILNELQAKQYPAYHISQQEIYSERT